MRLLSVIVSHNRLELTRRAVESYLQTATVPHVLIVVDNASTDGTVEWLRRTAHDEPRRFFYVARGSNGHAGAALNEGAALGLGDPVSLDPTFTLEDATHLHFSDNDVEFLPGWCDEIDRRFAGDYALGQLGLLEEKYERGCMNVGNNCVIPRRVWDEGVRWPEQPWHGEIEMSSQIRRVGWSVERVDRPVLIHHGWDWDAYPDYYAHVAAEKNLDPEWVRSHFDRMRAL